MKYDTRSHGQRLEDMFDEDTGGAHRDPDPDELLEEQDQAFRHFDSYIFARAASLTGRWEWDRANGGVAVDGELVGGAPNTCQPAAMEAPTETSPSTLAGGETRTTTRPLGASGSRPSGSVERFMWLP